MVTKWLTLSETVLIELAQCWDEGRDVQGFEEEASIIFNCFKKGQIREQDARNLIDKMRSAPLKDNYSYIEPNELEDIRQVRPDNRSRFSEVNWSNYYDKVYCAWLGRCAGYLLGRPFEGWNRERITGLLKDTDNYPVKRYVSSEIHQSLIDRYQVVNIKPDSPLKAVWINNVNCAPPDDDTNYTVLYLKNLENSGRNFTSLDIAESWLQLMPIDITCTAEWVAYKKHR
jgi:hypothetical protein